uniref:AAA domain-containing protein n=1 Tax=Trepomonas sp. PC1 TaxID=1076344 RepID=A0A146K4T9_9EUKA|eukprot:JAP91677.1 AAA domain-containing protein [Trepomonas sp. PC1]
MKLDPTFHVSLEEMFQTQLLSSHDLEKEHMLLVDIMNCAQYGITTPKIIESLIQYETTNYQKIVAESIKQKRWNLECKPFDYFYLFKVRLNNMIDLCFGEHAIVLHLPRSYMPCYKTPDQTVLKDIQLVKQIQNTLFDLCQYVRDDFKITLKSFNEEIQLISKWLDDINKSLNFAQAELIDHQLNQLQKGQYYQFLQQKRYKNSEQASKIQPLQIHHSDLEQYQKELLHVAEIQNSFDQCDTHNRYDITKFSQWRLKRSLKTGNFSNVQIVVPIKVVVPLTCDIELFDIKKQKVLRFKASQQKVDDVNQFTLIDCYYEQIKQLLGEEEELKEHQKNIFYENGEQFEEVLFSISNVEIVVTTNFTQVGYERAMTATTKMNMEQFPLYKQIFTKKYFSSFVGDLSLPPDLESKVNQLFNDSPEKVEILNQIIKDQMGIIYGPTGSGKTRLSAAISFVLKQLTGEKILICCADNASADAMIQQLKEVSIIFGDQDCFLRVYSCSKTDQLFSTGIIAENIKQHEPHHLCIQKIADYLEDIEQEKSFHKVGPWKINDQELLNLQQCVRRKIPVKVNQLYKNNRNKDGRNHRSIYSEIFTEIMENASIIVTTCPVAGDSRFATMNFPICLIDDASAISEPMTLIPLALGVQQVFFSTSFKLQKIRCMKQLEQSTINVSLVEKLGQVKNNPFPKYKLTQQFRCAENVCLLESPLQKYVLQPTQFKSQNNFLNLREAQIFEYKVDEDLYYNYNCLQQLVQSLHDYQLSDVMVIVPSMDEKKSLEFKSGAKVCSLGEITGQEADVVILSLISQESANQLEKEHVQFKCLSRHRKVLIVLNSKSNPVQINCLNQYLASQGKVKSW